MSSYTTKVTWLGSEYGCRVFFDGKLIVEGRCPSRDLIGPTLRDLLRTLDKDGGDSFTSAARYRISKEGNRSYQVKHIWSSTKSPSAKSPSANSPSAKSPSAKLGEAK
jgi:hypothetical protein